MVKTLEKHVLSILIVTLFGITIFMVSNFFELKISPFILFSSIVMVSIYVILSFEIIHRTSIAIFGALILVIASLLVGVIQPEETLAFCDRCNRFQYNRIAFRNDDNSCYFRRNRNF